MDSLPGSWGLSLSSNGKLSAASRWVSGSFGIVPQPFFSRFQFSRAACARPLTKRECGWSGDHFLACHAPRESTKGAWAMEGAPVRPYSSAKDLPLLLCPHFALLTSSLSPFIRPQRAVGCLWQASRGIRARTRFATFLRSTARRPLCALHSTLRLGAARALAL